MGESEGFVFGVRRKGSFVKTKIFLLAVGFSVLAAKLIWAQHQNPNAELTAQPEQRLAQSDSEARQLNGGPKELWLLRKLKIEEIIDRLKAGKSVDPKEIDTILKGEVQ